MHVKTVWFVVLLGACSSEPTGDLFSVDGFVRGRVTDETGAPVAGAWVALEGLYPTANGDLPVLDSTQTGEDGHYGGRLTVGNMPDAIVDFSLRVWPEPATRLAPARLSGLSVRLTAEQRDTVTVDVQLSSQPNIPQ
jgi:hypothetical protein